MANTGGWLARLAALRFMEQSSCLNTSATDFLTGSVEKEGHLLSLLSGLPLIEPYWCDWTTSVGHSFAVIHSTSWRAYVVVIFSVFLYLRLTSIPFPLSRLLNRRSRIRGSCCLHSGAIRSEEQIDDQRNILSHDLCNGHYQHSVCLWRRHRRHHRQ